MVVVLVGRETGKTTNARAIADHFGVAHVLEGARLLKQRAKDVRVSNALVIFNVHEDWSELAWREALSVPKTEKLVICSVAYAKQLLPNLRWPPA